MQSSTVPEETAALIIDSDVSESHHSIDQQQEDDETDSIPCIEEDEYNTSDLLSAVLQNEESIAADREQRLYAEDLIPANIVLLQDCDFSHQSSDSQSAEDEGSESRSLIEDRLEHAEALIHSYQDTIRSNEHLIDSLHKTITKTQEEAITVMSSHKDLEEAVQYLLQEREEEKVDNMVVPEPKNFLKMAMATSLMLYFFGITTEYPLIATVVVFLTEGLC